MVTGQKQNRVAMSYLKRQTLTLLLNRFKTSPEGWRSGESDNDAVQSLWQREGNYLSILRTNQKRMEATLDPIIFPRDRNLRQLYTLIVLSIRAYILFIVPLCHYRASTINRQIKFQECGVRHTWRASKSMTKDDAMTQVYTCS